VTYYQKRILAADPGALPQYGADGDFGGETVEAVKDFQAGAEISPTGNIDGLTADLLSGSALDLVGATAPEGMLPLAVGDGEKNGKRPWKNSDVRAVQGMLREAGSAARFKWGVYDDTIMPAAIMEIIPETGGDSNGRAFHGNDWAPLLVAMRAAPGPHGHNEYAMVDHPHTVPAQTI
jgi:peptidoglycan hydrolase-like protein with peptidoglycan-binding domain